MAVFEKNLDYTKLIQFTNGSLQLASFVQIRNALIQRFKDIYGNDIDVSAASADGQYINSIALLINNIFQTLKQGYEALDPAAATGQYLDTLCSFNNIQRITQSKSKAQLYIYNSTANDIPANKLTFIDKNNELWMWDNGGVDLVFKHGEYQVITDVECTTPGAISAPGASEFFRYNSTTFTYDPVGNHPELATWDRPDLYVNYECNGTIYQTVNMNGLWVWQYSDADIGDEEETDEALRSRRYLMLGNSSVTVLEGIKGNLLNIDGVKDVYIFNNPISGDGDVELTSAEGFEPIADNTSLLGHSIYVAIRYREGVNIDSQDIGKVIYNKLTPGISTTPLTVDNTDPDNPVQITTNGIQGELEIVRTPAFSDFIYWKICTSIHPQIQISFFINSKLYNWPLDPSNQIITTSHTAITDIEKLMVKNLQKYIDDVAISEYLTISNLLTIVQQSDIQKQGMNTFFAKDGNIEGVSRYPMNLAYLKYADSDYKFEYDVLNNIGTITIG